MTGIEGCQLAQPVAPMPASAARTEGRTSRGPRPSLRLGISAIGCDLGAHAAARHQHLRRIGRDRPRGAGRRAADGAEHHRRVARHGAPVQAAKLRRQRPRLRTVASSMVFINCSTRSATRASRVEKTLSRVAMPVSRKTGARDTWTMWATVSADEKVSMALDMSSLGSAEPTITRPARRA